MSRRALVYNVRIPDGQEAEIQSRRGFMRPTAGVIRTLVVATLVAAIQSADGQAQSPQPTFRVQVEAVELDASVTDARGNPVTDLTLSDFEVLEDGKPQMISSLVLVRVPGADTARPRSPLSPVLTDVRSNNRGAGRLYMIALDDVSPEQALRTRRFVRRFVEQYFGASDVGAVTFLGRGARTTDAQGLTSDPRRLLAAIDRFGGGFPADATPSPVPSVSGALGNPPAQPALSERDLAVRRTMASLRNVVEFMANVHGRRKTLLLFTEGFAVDLFRVVDYRGGVLSLAEEDAHRAVATATRNNVVIYPIDPRGLTADGGTADDPPAIRSGGADPLNTASTMVNAQSLQALASVTGGFAIANSNRFDEALKRIAQDASTYYVLGYSSTNDRHDGKYRRIEVRVKRPGAQVRARGGYVAPLGTERQAAPPSPPTTMSVATADALRSPIVVDGLPVRLFTGSFRTPSREALVVLAVDVDGSRLGLAASNGARVGRLEMNYLAVDTRNKVFPGKTETMTLALKPGTYDRAVRSGLRILAETRLPPGRYQLRVAVSNQVGWSGSVVSDLDVPDFAQGPVMLSGVVVGSSAAANALMGTPPSPLLKTLAGTISAVREFDRGDELKVYGEVYENLKDDVLHTVDFAIELRTEDGRVVQHIAGQRSSGAQRGHEGHKFAADLPLRDIAAGLYVLHLEARSNVSGRPAASRDIQIQVH